MPVLESNRTLPRQVLPLLLLFLVLVGLVVAAARRLRRHAACKVHAQTDQHTFHIAMQRMHQQMRHWIIITLTRSEIARTPLLRKRM